MFVGCVCLCHTVFSLSAVIRLLISSQLLFASVHWVQTVIGTYSVFEPNEIQAAVEECLYCMYLRMCAHGCLEREM